MVAIRIRNSIHADYTLHVAYLPVPNTAPKHAHAPEEDEEDGTSKVGRFRDIALCRPVRIGHTSDRTKSQGYPHRLHTDLEEIPQLLTGMRSARPTQRFCWVVVGMDGKI